MKRDHPPDNICKYAKASILDMFPGLQNKGQPNRMWKRSSQRGKHSDQAMYNTRPQQKEISH